MLIRIPLDLPPNDLPGAGLGILDRRDMDREQLSAAVQPSDEAAPTERRPVG